MACVLCIGVLSICAALVILKVYWKLATKWNKSYTCLVGKTAIITGANTGIGYITALDFAERGARVILACRNEDRAKTAHRNIIKATGNDNVIYKLVDMASLESVRRFAEDINATENRIDILLNNAGIGFLEQDYTVDGIQSIFHVNHISSFLLTHLLIDKLKKSAPSRIVNVASMAAERSKLNTTNLNEINQINPIIINKIFRDAYIYSDSKLCNILFTTELAKRIEGSGVTANVLHPGVIKTEFFRNLTGILRSMLNVAGSILLTPEEGAQTQIYLSVSKAVEGVNGGFFANCQQIQLYKTARDQNLAKMLWSKSEEMAKLSEKEKLSLI